MASQVLSGTSNVSYTNTTGQNVRIVINYMASANVDIGGTTIRRINLSWAGVTVTADYVQSIGRNLAFSMGGLVGSTTGTGIAMAANNMAIVDSSGGGAPIPLESVNTSLPTEIMLAAGQSFSATCGAYNIAVIPEAG